MITPAEAKGATAEELLEIKGMEYQIDLALRFGTRTFTSPMFPKQPKLESIMLDRYRKAGWDVRVNDSYRDSYIQFSEYYPEE